MLSTMGYCSIRVVGLLNAHTYTFPRALYDRAFNQVREHPGTRIIRFVERKLSSIVTETDVFWQTYACST